MIIMKKQKLIVGSLVLIAAISAASLVGYGPLKGSILGPAIDTKLKLRADTNADHILSVREIRSTLLEIIRGVLTGDTASDINEDGLIDREDIRATTASFRRLLVAECGNHIVDAAEECDDGNTENGDGCSAICVDEVGLSAALWKGSLVHLSPSQPLTFNQGAHAMNPSVTALRDPGDNAVAIWTESTLNSGDWRSPEKTSVVAAVTNGNEWQKTALKEQEDIDVSQCQFCTSTVAHTDAANRAHLFWVGPIKDVDGLVTGYGVYVSTYDGSVYSTPNLLSASDAVQATTPGVAFNAAGQGIAVWEESGFLKASHFSEQTGWGETETIAPFAPIGSDIILSGGTNEMSAPAVGMQANGKVVILYRSATLVQAGANGYPSTSRDDLYARTWTSSTGWSDEQAVVKNEQSWSGPSNSYPSLTYTHSVNSYAFALHEDGSGMVAYIQTDPSEQQGSVNFPIRRAYAVAYDGTAWSAPVNLQGNTEGAKDIQLSMHPTSHEYMAAWSQPCGQYHLCALASYFSDGSWTQTASPSLTGARALFLSYFGGRGSFVLGTARETSYGQLAETYLSEFSTHTSSWSTPYPSDSTDPLFGESQAGSASSGLHRLFTTWSQGKKTGYVNEDPAYYMYQLGIRAGFLSN